MQTPAPTTSPAPAETANAAEPSPQPEALAPLNTDVSVREGMVLVGFSRAIEGLHMDPQVARRFASLLNQKALEATRQKRQRQRQR